MAWTNPNTPNLADFTTFCQNQGIVASYTTADSPYFAWAFQQAMSNALTCPQISAGLYILAVYNAGAHDFIYLAQDESAGTFYQEQRTSFGILDFKPGVVMASGDENTSDTLVVPEWYRELPMSAQEQLKTPWGRAYIAYAQMYGPYVVGVS